MSRRSREYALSLHFRSHPEHLPRVKEKVQQLAKRCGFNQTECRKVAGAIEQACLNIIQTTYRNNFELPIILRGIHHGDRLEFRLRDFGKKTDVREMISDSNDVLDQAEYDSTVSMGGELCLVKFKPVEIPKAAVRRAKSAKTSSAKKRKSK